MRLRPLGPHAESSPLASAARPAHVINQLREFRMSQVAVAPRTVAAAEALTVENFAAIFAEDGPRMMFTDESATED